MRVARQRYEQTILSAKLRKQRLTTEINGQKTEKVFIKNPKGQRRKKMKKKAYHTPEFAVSAVEPDDVIMTSPLSENPTEVGFEWKW